MSESRWKPASGLSTAARLHWPALLVGGVAGCTALVVAVVCPPFHAPDEQKHFDYVQRLGEDARLADLASCTVPQSSEESHAIGIELVAPVARRQERSVPVETFRLPPSDAAARLTSGCNDAATHPPLYYAISALGYRSAAAGNVLQRIHGARLASVFWGMAGAIAAYLAGAWFFGRRSDGALVGLTFALQPMIVFLNGVVNNDSAAICAAAACWAALARLWRAEQRGRTLVVLGFLALVGVQTKTTFTLTLPVFAAGCLLVLGPGRLSSWVKTATVFLPAAAAEVAWRIHARAAIAKGMSGGGTSISLVRYLQSALDYSHLREVWIDEYWMAWGWVDVRLPLQHYWTIRLLLLLALAGLCLGWTTLDRRSRAFVGFVAAATVFLCGTLYAIEYAVIRRTPLVSFIQGRYALTLFPAHAAALSIGLRGLTARVTSRLDPAWVVPSLLVPLDVASVAALTLRFYHA
ncbi:MAG: DUF2142 domain-containing protein [Myxococcales bacterium]